MCRLLRVYSLLAGFSRFSFQVYLIIVSGDFFEICKRHHATQKLANDEADIVLVRPFCFCFLRLQITLILIIINTYVYVYTYSYFYMCLSAIYSIYLYTYICIYSDPAVHMYIHMPRTVHITQALIQIHMYMPVNTHTHIHIWTIHIHACMCVHMWLIIN